MHSNLAERDMILLYSMSKRDLTTENSLYTEVEVYFRDDYYLVALKQLKPHTFNF